MCVWCGVCLCVCVSVCLCVNLVPRRCCCCCCNGGEIAVFMMTSVVNGVVQITWSVMGTQQCRWGGSTFFGSDAENASSSTNCT